MATNLLVIEDTIDQTTASIEAPYKFNDDEIRTMGIELAKKTREIAEREASMKSHAKQLKAELDIVIGEAELLTHKINTGTEFREFFCRVEFDYDQKIKRFYDLSTETLIRSEPMSAYDLQRKFQFGDEHDDTYDESAEGNDAATPQANETTDALADDVMEDY